MLLRSRILVPVTAPPIEDGGVWVRDGRIAASGKWADMCALAVGDEVVDLGEVTLMPGLINAHAHLEYTGLAGQFTGTKGFSQWIRSINSAKQKVSPDTATEQWLTGAAMLVDSGTTTVADIQTLAGAQAANPKLTALRVIPFIEMTGVISRRVPAELLQEAEQLLGTGPMGGGFSPHSPYATLPGLLELSAQRARETGRINAIHVAESAEEFEMFTRRSGALYELIASLGRTMDDCDGRTPLQHIARGGLLQKQALVVHANYLTDEDVALLATSGASVVHCPRSHAFFDHQPFRYGELQKLGVNVCLGTDSLATMNGEGDQQPELNLLTELHRFRSMHPDVMARDILMMATVNGAKALGLEHELGSLNPGVRADVIALPYKGSIKQAEAAIFSTDALVEASFIGGRRIK
ncbi:MAG: amidohydrolase family protein [Verrucomicrobiota bacterium]